MSRVLKMEVLGTEGRPRPARGYEGDWIGEGDGDR